MSRASASRSRCFPLTHALGTLLLLAFTATSTPAPALLLSTPGVLTEDPLPALGGYHYVGALNGASGTYLGHGWVLTANHVGIGDFTLDGVTYSALPGSSIRLETAPGLLADLRLFRIYPEPPNPPLPIRSTKPVPGAFTIMIGNGFEQGQPITFDPNGPAADPPMLSGWLWGSHKEVRWGLNRVHAYPNIVILGTETFRTQFDDDLLEGQATNGDSGGAVLMYGTSPGPELAGIMITISLEFNQPFESALLTNQTIIASIDAYRDQILDHMAAVPEPSGSLPAGLALLSALALRRHPRARAGRKARTARPAEPLRDPFGD